MMARAVCSWVVLACCALVVAAKSQDHVLRFLSRDQLSQRAQETKEHNDDIVISGSEERGQPLQKAGTTEAVPHTLKSVVCPGGTTECPDGNTCCQLPSGAYGCCPRSNAVCCSDGIHCCPQDYKCNLSAGTCFQSGSEVSIPLETKKPAVPRVAVVICPDGSECEDDSTCCKLPAGDYGCCPLPEAVCCTDEEHCCPKGYQCNLAKQTCVKGPESIPWLAKQPAVSRTPNDVICPDKKEQCPDGQTCCMTQTGAYACCPVPNAVCCSDKIHCCPQGYTCDLAAGTCNKGHNLVPILVKTQSTPRTPSNLICPDQSRCTANQTCCKADSGRYACCPLPDAVCCSDKTHCCPHGYTCDMAAGTCVQGPHRIPFMVKTQSTLGTEKVICPDQRSECADGQTCCKLSSGEYGCCPRPNAVCCEDHLHCCPQGYKCDTTAGTCNKGEESLPWDEKQPATSR